MKKFLLLLTLPAFSLLDISAGSIYVSPTGSDSADGTLTSPMKSPALAGSG